LTTAISGLSILKGDPDVVLCMLVIAYRRLN
jgi:hypothetical protein